MEGPDWVSPDDLSLVGYSPIDFWEERGKIKQMAVLAWTGEHWLVVNCVLDAAYDEPYFEMTMRPYFMTEWPKHWRWFPLHSPRSSDG